ncbi:hypothetical protein [[Eubacterium] cellulosolvens]
MQNEYPSLRKQSKEIFELIDGNRWSDAEKKINDLIPKYPDYQVYISELSRILNGMKKNIRPWDYLDRRRDEYQEKEIFPQQISDALVDFQMYISKPKSKLK